MNADAAGTMVAAWVAVPVLLTLSCAGLGELVSRIVGRRIGAMTVPAGFAAGVATATLLLKVGASSTLTAVVLGTGAIVGAGLLVSRRAWLSPGALPIGLAGAAAYLVAMAPLLVSGRVAVLGYVLNNDIAIHLSAIDLISTHGTSFQDLEPSSFSLVSQLIDSGYPLGGYVWMLYAGTLTGLDPLTFWTPVLAWHVALLALVAVSLLRQAGTTPAWAGALGAIVACGYLTYSFFAQGGLKETATAVCVYGSAALLLAPDDGPAWRRWLAGIVVAGAALSIFGVGAAVWLGPIFLVALAVAAASRSWSRPSRRTAAVAAAAILLAIAIAIPLVKESLDFVSASEATLRDPAQTGNLLGPVPWRAALNVWLSRDYRVLPPDEEALTMAGWLFALVLAVVGLAWTVLRRHWAIGASLLSGAVGTYVITTRYSIYLDAKALAVLAPILGVLTSAGILLVGARHLVLRLGLVALFGLAVLASAFLVHRGAWLSPEARFAEMQLINERFAGRGPMLVNEREQFSIYLLRDAVPWEPWGSYQPVRGFVEGEVYPKQPPHTPDFDDYRHTYVQGFPFLLERRRPGGSRPPSNFRLAFETTHYRVWERDDSPGPVDHVGLGADAISGDARIDCGAPALRTLFREARASRQTLLVGPALPRPIVVARPRDWSLYDGYPVPPPVGQITRFGGSSLREFDLAPGRYTAWTQGSFGPGARLYVDDQLVGRAAHDLQSPDSWKTYGAVSVAREKTKVYVEGAIDRRWRPGGGHFDITGPTVLVSDVERAVPRRVDANRAASLCGQRADWVELGP